MARKHREKISYPQKESLFDNEAKEAAKFMNEKYATEKKNLLNNINNKSRNTIENEEKIEKLKKDVKLLGEQIENEKSNSSNSNTTELTKMNSTLKNKKKQLHQLCFYKNISKNQIKELIQGLKSRFYFGIEYKNNTTHYMDIPDKLYKKTDNDIINNVNKYNILVESRKYLSDEIKNFN